MSRKRRDSRSARRNNGRAGHSRRRFRRQTRPGAVPGTLETDPQAPKPVLKVLQYDGKHFDEFELQDLSRLKFPTEGRQTVWLNVNGLGDAETIAAIGALLGLHPLALEDVIHVHQRPKVEEYADHLFIVARMPQYNGGLQTEQVSLFLGKGFVVTFQERPGDCFDPVRTRLRSGRGQIRTAGADYLAYALLDAIVDAYFPVLEEFGERLDRLDAEVTENGTGETVAGMKNIRADLLELRRTMWSTRDAVNTLIREGEPLISPETAVYLRDCYDHTVQIVDVAEVYRETCSDLRDFYFSRLSTRTNEIMKVLTMIATIFIPLSFIAGLYGMNFNPQASPWNMPELNWFYGYPFALGLMGGIAVLLVIFIWRRGWFKT